MDATSPVETYAPGTPIIGTMDKRGFISAVHEATTKAFVLSGGMRPILHEYETVWDSGYIDTLSDGIVAPMIERAARAHLPMVADIAERREAARVAMAEQRQARERQQADATEARRLFLIEAKKKLPANAKAVIVAELIEDQCDSMTDYFGSTTKRTVILAFSTHTRDLFPELRKAALNFPETVSLATAPAEAEHREKYSMGGGYYLKDGFRHRDGWQVEKCPLYHGAESIPVGEWALSTPVKTARPASTPATGGARIEEHTHTKKGFQMWIVVLPERVSREEFDRLLNAAKARKGWYTRQWEDTPAGFAFKVQSAAESFLAEEFGGPSPEGPDDPMPKPSEPRAPAASPNTAERLRTMADKMESEIAAKLGDRLANTPKRQRQAACARQEGARLQRTQSALRALADLHERGTVPPVLSRITSRKAVYDLAGTIIDTSHAGYYDAGIDTGKPAKTTPEAQAIWALIGGPSPAALAAEDLRRRIEALQFARIAGYFATPRPVVADMLDLINLPANRPFTLLEPEGGSGAILDVVREEYPQATLSTYERHFSLREILTLKGYDIAGDDFLEADDSHFDFVMMNPPFENGQEIEHVRKAFSLLSPGGRLVSVMSSGPFYRGDRQAVAFREWFEDHGGERIELPAGSFKASGTGIETLLIRLKA